MPDESHPHAHTAKHVHGLVDSLQQSSPSFNADKQAILTAIEPMLAHEHKKEDKAAEAKDASEAPVHDEHPEIVKPETDKVEDRPENTDNTPEVQKDAKESKKGHK